MAILTISYNCHLYYLGLSKFIVMMRKFKVNTTGVNIKR